MSAEEEKTRYSYEELQEFKELILKKALFGILLLMFFTFLDFQHIFYS